MEKKTFDIVWNTTVDITNDLIDKIQPEIDNEILFLDKKNEVFNEYEKIKANLKENYYKGKTEGSLICHHKIAACYCNALINHKLLKFDLKDIKSFSNQKILAQINYKVAFLSGLSIVYYYLLDKYENSSDNNYLKKEFTINYLLKRGILEFPKVSDTHDTFLEGLVKMLGIQELNNDKFDTLCFSYIYYFVEEYNKRIIQENFWVNNPNEFGEYIRSIDYI